VKEIRSFISSLVFLWNRQIFFDYIIMDYIK
jgi:hypothetical protein